MKWSLAIAMVSLVLALSGCITAKPPLHVDLAGDADGNGLLNVWDVRSIERSAVARHLQVIHPANADVSQDGAIDEGDAEAVDKKLHGLPTVEVSARRLNDQEASVIFAGDTVVIRASDSFLPRNVRSGSARVLSASANYDSGVMKLTHDVDGRSMYCHWHTSSLPAAADYRVEVTLLKETPDEPAPAEDTPATVPIALTSTVDNTELEEPSPDNLETITRSIEIALKSRSCRPSLLSTTVDLSLPFWHVGLQMSRRYWHDPTSDVESGSLGRGWVHAYELRLKEHTDGSIQVCGAGVDLGLFVRAGEGRYNAPSGMPAKLSRDADGTFYLLLPTGDCWHFDQRLLAASVIDQEGHRIDFTYDDEDTLVSAEDQSGQWLKFLYGDEGLLKAVENSTGRRISYEFDDEDNLIKVTSAGNSVATYEYDEDHRLTSAQSDGEQLSCTFDVEGRLIAKSLNGKVCTTSYAERPSGAVQRTFHHGSSATLTQQLTSSGLVAAEEDNYGRTLQLKHGADERLESVTSGGNTAHLKVDELNRVVAAEADDGQSFLQAVYPNGKKRELTVIDGSGVATRSRYLDSGAPTHLLMPDGTSSTRYYSSKGRRFVAKTVLRNGQKLIYVYDERGLLIEKQFPDKSRCIYKYDDLGNLVAAENDWGRLAFEYAESHLNKVRYPDDREIRYQRDGQGRMTLLAVAQDVSLRLERAPSGELTAIKNDQDTDLVHYERNDAGDLKVRRLSNGVTTLHTYEDARLLAIEHQGADGASLLRRQFGYEPSGVTIATPDGEDSFAHDAKGQLVSATYRDGKQESFEYDSAGNRTLHVKDDREIPFATNVLNQYTLVGNGSRMYDLNGNLNALSIDDRKTTFQHDAENRLVLVRLADGKTIRYRYDPLGRLATRIEGKLVQHFYWDHDRLVAIEDDNGVDRVHYLWGERDDLVAIQSQDSTRFALSDPFGNIEMLVDEQGQVVANARYSVFGEVLEHEGEDIVLGFAGAYRDPATGLSLISGRWYSARTGSFLEPTLSNGYSNYIFAGNSPLQSASQSKQGLWQAIANLAFLPGQASNPAAVCPRYPQSSVKEEPVLAVKASLIP